MGRKPNPDRKPELLDQIVDYLGEHGLGSASLRPLAGALGVSTYTLVYHFGSKERLVAEALERAERRQMEMVEKWMGEQPDLDVAALIRRLWRWTCADENLPIVRLAFEAITLSATEIGLPGEVREHLVTNWVDALTTGFTAQGMKRADARRLATIVNAAFVGFVLDLLATGDRRRLDASLNELLHLVAA